jgi:hypothetical protein
MRDADQNLAGDLPAVCEDRAVSLGDTPARGRQLVQD